MKRMSSFLETALAAGALFGASFPAVGADLTPRLKLGVVSDLHIILDPRTGKFFQDYDDRHLVRALERFRDEKVDAVLFPGDMSDSGTVEELRVVADAWRRVFPDDRGTNGRRVARLLICGNHEMDGAGYSGAAKRLAEAYPDEAERRRHLIVADPAAAWRSAFGEMYESVWKRTVKGFVFFGVNWVNERGNPDAAAFIAREARKLGRSKPFFVLQHPHPKATCYGDWAWGHDDGEMTKVLSAFPNAVVFSGHSHYSLVDERSVWQGGFTSIGCGSLRYAGHPHSEFSEGLENSWCDGPKGDAVNAAKLLGATWCNYAVSQAMTVSVFADALRIARFETRSAKPLGDDWLVPVPAVRGKGFSPERRRAGFAAPEFPAGAAVRTSAETVKNRGGKAVSAVVLTFPAANASSSRVYYYEVSALDAKGRTVAMKRVLSEAWCEPVGGAHYDKAVRCVFACDAVAGAVRWSVVPVGFFSARGRALSVESEHSSGSV